MWEPDHHRWYTKGKGGGVKTWDARSDIFPHGLEYLAAKTGWPTQLHNRMWSPDTTYDKRNGGKYTFVNDGSAVVVPDDQQFWNDLVSNKTLQGKGMFMYEQDWLDVEFDKSKSLGESATLGRTWMMQMNNGCANSNAEADCDKCPFNADDVGAEFLTNRCEGNSRPPTWILFEFVQGMFWKCWGFPRNYFGNFPEKI